jgi:CMP-N-acetylneuraminic acid synthetase
MKYLVVIPARGGSKRTPRKNIRPLGGKPLINWSIHLAKKVFEPSEILVTTDDKEIAAIAQNESVLVPWLRPQILSTDSAKSSDVIIHAIDWYEKENGLIDGAILLQPTSPFRSEKTLRDAIELFEKNNQKSVVTVSLSNSHPSWCFKIEDNRLVPFLSNNHSDRRSQGLDKSFSVNGLVYIISPSEIRQNQNFVGPDTIPLLVSSEKEAIDIDSEFDFKLASHFCTEQE